MKKKKIIIISLAVLAMINICVCFFVNRDTSSNDISMEAEYIEAFSNAISQDLEYKVISTGDITLIKEECTTTSETNDLSDVDITLIKEEYNP